jgi:predicted Rossmann-fold nucleotide-binding protein
MQKYKIGVFGSAVDVESVNVKAQELGEILGDYKDQVIVVNGAAAGLPYKIAYAASKKGAEVWGFSPAPNLEGQMNIYPENHDHSIYSKLFYVPEKYEFISDIAVTRKYRNVTSTATCDAGIIISGRWGTMNEFTNLYDMGKVIGVLTGTGGVADEIEGLMKKISKQSKAVVIFNSDPRKLINGIFERLKSNVN